ncbi:MAG: RluA family pseudouridine synthase [Deferribacteraceae bacterium]|jgi:RluA family pseudouridine synthase|nr:RluA family pseudouridine synthase [Deferribacteraceae bacterium]
MVAVSKPHGLHTIDDRKRTAPVTAKSLLTSRYGKIFVVHRLDAGTGGVVVFAKTPQAHSALCKAFEHGKVGKEYYAIVTGAFGGAVSVLLPISTKPNHGKYKINFKSGKTSVTTFFNLERYGDATLVKAIPVTGRTHQIRVHLKALKHPLYKDWLYNIPDSDRRLTLFSKRISIPHPVSGKQITIEAELSEFMKNILKCCKNSVLFHF